MEYQLEVADLNMKPQHITALHLITSFAYIVAGLIIFIYNFSIQIWGFIILLDGLGLIFLTIFKNKWLIEPKRNFIIRIYELLFSIPMALYFFKEKIQLPEIIFSILSVVLLYALFEERKISKPKILRIDTSGILNPSSTRSKFIPWFEIEDAILKYETFTVNCLDNRYYQWNIQHIVVAQDDLNEFCNQQIELSKDKRILNNW